MADGEARHDRSDWPEITIDTYFVTIHGILPDGGDFLLPRWLSDPLLAALLREAGYEKRWGVHEDGFHYERCASKVLAERKAHFAVEYEPPVPLERLIEEIAGDPPWQDVTVSRPHGVWTARAPGYSAQVGPTVRAAVEALHRKVMERKDGA